MRIVVTGADGFIGSNLCVRLRELGEHEVVSITRGTQREDAAAALASADIVFHLAGVNRPRSAAESVEDNSVIAEVVCATLSSAARKTTVIFASSSQATLDNAYGRSKRAAEDLFREYGRKQGATVKIFRLPNVFGKWCRPHYNSAVVTFCYQLARGLPISVNDASAPLTLAYIDDVVDKLVDALSNPDASGPYVSMSPVYNTTVGEVAQLLREIAGSRASLLLPRVGSGLVRALYSTYVSYLPSSSFNYNVAKHSDSRGVFVEMLKTPDCGQFSYFTAHPGVTRGEHYHHSKTEKFLVIRGTALFGFRNMRTGELHEFACRGGEGSIVETVPGWTHNVKNIGDDELIVMLWANEIFDQLRPDTIRATVAP